MEINLVSWAKDMGTGISWQDAQNRELYQVFHALYEETHFGRGREQAQKTLSNTGSLQVK